MTRPYVPDNHDLPDEFERRHEHDEVGDFDDDPIAWIGIVFVGVLLGVAAFIGIVIGALL